MVMRVFTTKRVLTRGRRTMAQGRDNGGIGNGRVLGAGIASAVSLEGLTDAAEEHDTLCQDTMVRT